VAGFRLLLEGVRTRVRSAYVQSSFILGVMTDTISPILEIAVEPKPLTLTALLLRRADCLPIRE